MTARAVGPKLEESAARFPDRIAVVDGDGSGLTYRELTISAPIASRVF